MKKLKGIENRSKINERRDLQYTTEGKDKNFLLQTTMPLRLNQIVPTNKGRKFNDLGRKFTAEEVSNSPRIEGEKSGLGSGEYKDKNSRKVCPNQFDSKTKPTVLIVDDEKDFAITLKEILEMKGYEAIIARNGKEALELISAEPVGSKTRKDLTSTNQSLQCRAIDIGLIDLKLPDISGLELIESFKLYSPTTEIIVITGNPSLPSAVKALNAGAFGYIEKPYNIDRLFILLERALERKNLLCGLKEAERRHRHLLEGFGCAILLLNLKTLKILQPNKAFTELFGYSGNDLTDLGLIFKDFFFAEDSALLAQFLERLQNQGVASLETKLRRRGNVPFWAEVRASTLDAFDYHPPQAENQHKPAEPMALTLILDLTKRKETETQLLKTKGYLETIFTNIASGVAIINLDYTIIDVNPAYCKLLGLEKSNILGKKCYELHHNQKMSCVNLGEICPIANCRVTGVKSRAYHEHRTQNGQTRYLEITVTPLKDEVGNLTSFISVGNDFTENRKAQQELKLLNTELRKIAQAKTEFISAVAHELRTPLATIMEGVSLVEDGSLGLINQRQKRFLALIKNNVQRCANLINDLLDLAKIETGRFELNPVNLNLAKIIRKTAQGLKSLIKEKELKLSIQIPKELPQVLADEQSVFRVMTNLLTNIIKFIPAGGQIIIRANHWDKSVSPPQAKKQPMVVISVTDSNPGITFNQPSKLNESQSASGGWIGFGLALSKELVKLNGGRVWVENEEGKGSKLVFSLPAVNKDESN